MKSKFAKGRISNLSPMAAANGFVQCWPPYNAWFNCTRNPCDVVPSAQPFLQGLRTWPTDRQTDHATPSVAIGRILCISACYVA